MTAIKVQGRDDVLTVMRRHREQRGLTHLEMDERVGLGSGHYGKIERMGADWGKAAVRLNPSILNCLDALDLELIIAPKGEVPAERVVRDVRLPPAAPVSNVVRLVPGPSANQAPGWFSNWLQDRSSVANVKRKKPATRRARAG